MAVITLLHRRAAALALVFSATLLAACASDQEPVVIRPAPGAVVSAQPSKPAVPPPAKTTKNEPIDAVLLQPGPLYKVGNPYEVGGVRYVPVEDPNYREVGMASWYGPKFHGKKTANGETFDQWSMTGAHRTLPMPSVARVTNLSNGRSVLLRINDRGPFSRNRIVDVSRAAARQLGFEEKGTTKVLVEALPEESQFLKDATLRGGEDAPARVVVASAGPAPEQAAAQPVFRPGLDTGKGVFVQVGAFTDRDMADWMANHVAEFGSVSITTRVLDGTTFYRTRLGPVATARAADGLVRRLRSAGIEAAWITKD